LRTYCPNQWSTFKYGLRTCIFGRIETDTVELRKTGASQYEVLVEEQVIGQVWSWHGTWSAQANGKTYHGPKSRKQSIERVKQIYELRGR